MVLADYMALTSREIDLSEDEVVELVKVAKFIIFVTFPHFHSIFFRAGGLRRLVVREADGLPLPGGLGPIHLPGKGGRRQLMNQTSGKQCQKGAPRIKKKRSLVPIS